jgi:trigger factor
MQQTIETLSPLERRLTVSVLKADIDAEVSKRLARIAKDAALPGFRRGKVPVRMIARSHGPQVQSEVLSDRIGKALTSALTDNQLRMAGNPLIEPIADGDAALANFRATFEIYPEIPAVDPASLKIERAVCGVGDAEVDKTLDVMRRQRGAFKPVERAAQDGDRVRIDFKGSIDGVAFPGGTAEGYAFELGRGRMLPEFEMSVRGANPGESRTFTMTFPADYHGADVAGKEAQFDVTVHAVEERELPELNEDFAKSVGVADGSLEALRAEVLVNVEREVAARLRMMNRDNVMEALLVSSSFALPKALLQTEQERLQQTANAEITARGGSQIPDLSVFAPAAERRVRLSLLIGEIVFKQNLQPQADQVRAAVENIARGYESPEEVVKWYLSDRQRVAEIESSVLEDNVIDWIMNGAQVTDRTLAFDDLMEAARG